MGNSIQDQLLKAGLANKKQAVKAKKAQHNKQKLKATGVHIEDESTTLAKKAQQEKAEHDRELNRIKQQQADKKAIQAQIQELINLNRITERGEIEFSFTDESAIKTLMLTNTHRDELISGKLTIARIGNSYDIVPRQVADKINERDDTVIVLQNTRTDTDAVDDEYADYQVPDDLMW